MRIDFGGSRVQKVLATCNTIIAHKKGDFEWTDADIQKMAKEAGPVITNLEKMLQTAQASCKNK